MKCYKCGNDFEYMITNGGFPGGKDREIIYCPWCDAENGSIVTSGIINTYKNEAKNDMDIFSRNSSYVFEDIKQYTDEGDEFWYARELQEVLEYSEWRNFNNVLEKAQIACNNSGNNSRDHFVEVNKMVDIGSGAEREIDDIMLSRYACYLIVQNGDPRKEVIALGQTYFAVKTRQQELIEDYEQLSEEQKRLAIRNEMILHNKSLA